MTTADPIDVHRTQAIADIRALADFLEEHPDIPLPHTLSGNIHIRDPDEFASAAEALGDKAVLAVHDGYAVVTRRFGSAAFSVQACVHDLLAEERPPLDRTEAVRRALRKAAVSTDG